MKIAIVILNFNGNEDTLACLDSLEKLKDSTMDREIIVVDNASTDGSPQKINQKYPQITLITNPKNLGFAEGNNVGIRYALQKSSDFILLLNNDTTVDPSLIGRLVSSALAYKTGGIFSPKIYFAKGSETHNQRYKSSDFGHVIWYAGGLMDWNNVLASHRGVDEVDAGQYEEPTKTAFATGCAMLVRRETFETVGLFDSKFYLYYEDLDFCERARRKGFEIYYIPKAFLWHKNAASSGGTGSKLQSYYITRNRLLIGMRYAPWRTKLALFREATNLLMRGTSVERQAVGDFLRKKYGVWETMGWRPRMPNLLRYLPRASKKPSKP